MKIILLAAGRSTRMWPVSDKNFLNFCGKPLILHQIEALRKHLEPQELIVIGGKHNLKQLVDLKVDITIVEQEDISGGMAAALLSVESNIENETFLVVSSNDIVEPHCYDLIKKFVQENKNDSAVIGYKVKKYFPGGYLTVDNNNLLRGIIEKPKEGSEPSDLVNIVVHLHANPKTFFTTLKQTISSHDDRYEKTVDALIHKGEKYHVLTYGGMWQPIKYPWHVLKAVEYFLSTLKPKISPKATIAKTAVIKGNVVIADDVKVFDHAVIQGPAYIGKGSMVTNGALVRNSILGERCVVGHVTEIARSYLADDVWTHKNYIGDSVIDSNCSFGSGAVTGNLRLDEQEISVNVKDRKISTGMNKVGLICGANVRCGINTSFMPGVKVGAGSFIGAGITVPQDIPDKSFVTAKHELNIRKNKKRPKKQSV